MHNERKIIGETREKDKEKAVGTRKIFRVYMMGDE